MKHYQKKKMYKAICESNGIQISMSRKGTTIDDSPIESWHSLLKKETLYNNNITSLQEYIQLVEEWILLLYKVSFLSIECQLSIGESSIGVPLRAIEIIIPLDSQIALYS